MNSIDPFKVLGVARNATQDEIKRAYREKAAKYHPDHGGDSWVFQQVSDAYQMLKETSDAPQQGPARSQDGSTTKRHGAEKQSQFTSSAAGDQTPQAQAAGTQSATGNDHQMNDSPGSLFFGELPLQSETTTFVFVSVLDIFMTYILLRFQGVESNPIANYFLIRYGLKGLIFFKMVMVAIVTTLAQIIARKSIGKARMLLRIGTLIVSAVVVYSVYLILKHVVLA